MTIYLPTVVVTALWTYMFTDMTVKQNRQFAREEINKINDQQTKQIHPANSPEKLKAWQEKKLAEQREWLQKPYYYQFFNTPPIATVVELWRDLDEKN